MIAVEQAPSETTETGRHAGATQRSTRRCLVTGDVRPRSELMRFVVGPDDLVVPDLDARLPGRGLWLTGRRDIVAQACAKRAFARGAKRNVEPMTGPEGESLELFVEAALFRRAVGALTMARKTGTYVSGFEKVRAALSGRDKNEGASAGDTVLLCASDAGEDGRDKIARLADRVGGVVRVDVFDAAELGAASGRDHTVHAIVLSGGAAQHVLETVRAYTAYRGDLAPAADIDLMD
ncbi:MAG: RNA-binding protein [Alphaproteobacteria bacterium]|nr:RNA-binding protein [Alphaproteobacteria bacterium]